MCGRFNNHLPKMLGWSTMLAEWPEVPLSYNVAPSADIAAFTLQDDQWQGRAMRWGMIPSWAKEFTSNFATFNARIETVSEKPTFRAAWSKKRRCVIPMAGYYEWKQADDGKQPFYLTDRNVGGLVAAGLYEPWQGQLSCTMLTKPAMGALSAIHPRMPVLLNPASARRWLEDDTAAQRYLHMVEAPSIVYWPVTKAVGNPRNDKPDLCAPIDLKPASNKPGSSDA
jgi:putative SOS response-associated peptidase YedK